MIKPSPRSSATRSSTSAAPPATACSSTTTAKNVEAAAALGFATHHFAAPDALAADLRTRGLLPPPRA
jgi:hypothetical protein